MQDRNCLLRSAALTGLGPDESALPDRLLPATDLAQAETHLITALSDAAPGEQSQAISEAQYRAGFEFSHLGQVHFHPTSGAIIRVNAAYARMFGYRPVEMVGLLVKDLTHLEDHDPQRYGQLLRGEVEAYTDEQRYVRRDGTLAWCRFSMSMARAPEGGRAFLAIAIIEDIDDRHRARLALEAAKRDLEAIVVQRTEALAQRDLLLREVYHRVKNNLQIIDSLMVMQAQSISDPSARAALDDMRGRVYALGLVHQQLMGSDDLETFDVAPFLQDLSRHLMAGVGADEVSISVHAPPLRVGLDFAIPLGLLVTELVTNAMKHAFDGRPGTIRLALEEAEGGRVVLQVSDDGGGYDPTAADGSLGLLIIQGLVRQLKGEMTVHSHRGAHTLVRLPAPVRI